MMAGVERILHPCELENCSCIRTALPFVWVPGEEKPRCFECLKPVQEFSRLESQDRAAARWRLFDLGILENQVIQRLWRGTAEGEEGADAQ